MLQTFRTLYKGHSTFVTVADETIESTLFHPYWVVRGDALDERPCREHIPAVPSNATTLGRWVDAGDLRVGDELLLRDGRIMPVQTVWTRPYEGDVYNVEVEDLHCYAVGNNGALVHNSNNGEGGAGGKASPSDLDGPGTSTASTADDLQGVGDPRFATTAENASPRAVAPKANVPQKAQDTLGTVRQTGAPPSGYRGGRTFANDGRGGGQVLPRTKPDGSPITYNEYDVNPYTPGVNRGAERLVVGSDGRSYYTSDHYTTFTEF